MRKLNKVFLTVINTASRLEQFQRMSSILWRVTTLYGSVGQLRKSAGRPLQMSTLNVSIRFSHGLRLWNGQELDTDHYILLVLFYLCTAVLHNQKSL